METDRRNLTGTPLVRDRKTKKQRERDGQNERYKNTTGETKRTRQRNNWSETRDRENKISQRQKELDKHYQSESMKPNGDTTCQRQKDKETDKESARDTSGQRQTEPDRVTTS